MRGVFRKVGNYIITRLEVWKKPEVREGVEPPWIGFAGPRITAPAGRKTVKADDVKLASKQFTKF